MYVPSTGRFLSRDPLAVNGVDLLYEHAYVYARSNPMNRVDPSGQKDTAIESISDFLKGLRGFVGDFEIIIEHGTFCGLNRRPTSCPVTQADKDRAVDCVDHVCLDHDCCLDTWRDFCKPIKLIRCHAALCNGDKACYDHGCKSGTFWDRLKCQLAAKRIVLNYCPSTALGDIIEDIFDL